MPRRAYAPLALAAALALAMPAFAQQSGGSTAPTAEPAVQTTPATVKPAGGSGCLRGAKQAMS